MSTIFHRLSEPGILTATEQNFAEEMAGFGHALPEGELHQDDELTWFLTGQGGPNGVLLTNFSQDDQAHIHSRIEEVITYFSTHQIREISWRIGPATYPHNLSDYLEAHGLKHRATTTCMALLISETLPKNPPEPTSNIVIREVTDTATLQIKCHIEKIGFGSTEAMAQRYYQTYVKMGFGLGTNWHHYIGWQDGKAVAIGAILLYAGIAGIYGVTTLPEARRQGIAATITRYLLMEIQRLGYHVAVITPNDLSEGIYRRIGFHDFCQMHYYKLSISNHKLQK